MVASLFAVPAAGTLGGRRLTLLDALGTATDRYQQVTITHAYWQLAAAVGEYHLRFDAVERARRLEPRPADLAVLRVERSKATEALRRAELEAARAQQSLAEAARLNAAAPLPLPADRPHVGPYRTNFDEVYAMQDVPARDRLIHRALPLRRRGIDARAAAVQAAEDALEAAVDSYREGTGELAAVLACLAGFVEQRAALVWDVCQYNHEIADYALSVAAIHASPRTLVAMLIFPASEDDGNPRETENLAWPQDLPTKRSATAPALGVQPATWIFPAPQGRAERGAGLPAAGQPTLAPPKPGSPPLKSSTPAEPAPLPPKPVPERIAERPTGEPQGASAALYPALVSASAAARVKNLSAALHWNRSLPADAGQSTELAECLRDVSSSDRRSVIEAFWTTRQRVAEYEATVAHGQLIEQLVPLVLDQRQRPSGALDMLRLHAARLGSEAEEALARVELLRSQFELTRRAGRALDGPWLVPATAPYAGPYLLKLDAQRPEVVKQPSVQRLAAAIPLLNDALKEQAAAVVEADSARAAAASAYQIGGRDVDQLLTCLRSQSAETLAFLQTLTAYNRAIAEYALTVLSPTISAEQLVQTLVIVR